MASKKASEGPAKGRKTERVNVWLDPDQMAWLKSKKNASQTLGALVTEAMNLEKLAESVKVGKRAGKRGRGNAVGSR